MRPNRLQPSRPTSRPVLGRAPLVVPLAVLALVVLTLAGCATTEKAAEIRPDQVVVKKSERRLMLLANGQVLREYRVALGKAPVGHKLRQGDQRTPEGEYILDWRNPNSQYYKAIHISYPNTRDVEVARRLGVDPGGQIMIHGLPGYIQSPKVRAEYVNRDWTNGCIAVQDHEMDEIWQAVRDGTPIRIEP